jgi:hypothetical protein
LEGYEETGVRPSDRIGHPAYDADIAAAAPAITMREALREIWQAASYPIRGNEDWRIAARLDAEALERAGKAVRRPNDPPEFAAWIAALRDPKFPALNAKTSCRQSTICSTLTEAEACRERRWGRTERGERKSAAPRTSRRIR